MLNRLTHERELAKKLVEHSCKIKENEKVLISYSDTPSSFIEILIEEIHAKKAISIPFRMDKIIKRRLLLNSKITDFEYYSQIIEPIMKSVDAVILISGSHNDFELNDIPTDIMNEYQKKYVEPIHFKIRCSKKWVLLRYPTPSFAQSSKLSTEKFYNFFFNVCTLDYSSLNKKMNPLKTLMENTDKVHIKAPNTDLTFSIKNMPAIKCSGECNIPDGEIYTAPIKDSVNGYIAFNIPVIDNGLEFSDIKLVFKDGKIIDHNCNHNNEFKNILDTDAGSRYLGEFAFGLNPLCEKPLKDILFDEKMHGSIHLAIGSSYDDCNNGNKSSVHLDLILSLREEYGGGEIYFDDELIYKNGKFLYPNLVALNSENLL